MKARQNPFNTERLLKVRYKMDDQGWDRLLQRFILLGYRAAIVGPQGSGKTTLMEDIAERLTGCGFMPIFWRQNHRKGNPTASEIREFFSSVGPAHLVCIDSAELLSWRVWRRILRASKSSGGVLITAHKEGRLPTLKRCFTSEELLGEILSDLLPEHKLFSPNEIETLFQRHRGNIRDALRECYKAEYKRAAAYTTI